jgi:hypothetical protein
MKHATAAALDVLEPLLVKIRQHPVLRERTRGVFYLRGVAFLHFHEDPAGLFADLRVDGDFVRYPVTKAKDHRTFLAALAAAL